MGFTRETSRAIVETAMVPVFPKDASWWEKDTAIIRCISFRKEGWMCSQSVQASGRQIGLNGIMRTVGPLPRSSAPRVCRALIENASEHQGDGLLFDDMTVIVVRAA
jgi:hypothetical protein